MWKDLREHKPNIWQQSILQTTGPVWLVGMRKHQGRPLHFQRFPTPHKEKMNWKKLFLISHKALLPSHSQLPSPDLEKSFLQETPSLSRLSALPSQGQKWILGEVPSILTHTPNLKSTNPLSWSYFHLACSFFHLTQFQSPWKLSLGLLQGVLNKQLNCHFPRPQDGSPADQRTTLKGINGKFNMYFNRLVMMVKTTQICSPLVFMLVILIFAWSYTRLYRYWITCNKQTKALLSKKLYVYSF